MEWKSTNVMPYGKPSPANDLEQISGCQVGRTLICAQGEDVGVCIFIYKMEDNEWIPEFKFRDFIIVSESKIDYWMPLPIAQKKE